MKFLLRLCGFTIVLFLTALPLRSMGVVDTSVVSEAAASSSETLSEIVCDCEFQNLIIQCSESIQALNEAVCRSKNGKVLLFNTGSWLNSLFGRGKEISSFDMIECLRFFIQTENDFDKVHDKEQVLVANLDTLHGYLNSFRACIEKEKILESKKEPGSIDTSLVFLFSQLEGTLSKIIEKIEVIFENYNYETTSAKKKRWTRYLLISAVGIGLSIVGVYSGKKLLQRFNGSLHTTVNTVGSITNVAGSSANVAGSSGIGFSLYAYDNSFVAP